MENKRVNISYTIELDELPTETSRLFDKFINMSDTLVGVRDYDKGQILSMDALKEVDVLRKRLARMDFVLMDVGNIIQSYLAHQLEDETNEQKGEHANNNEPVPDTTQQVAAPNEAGKLFSDLSELNEKLIGARDALEQNEISTKG